MITKYLIVGRRSHEVLRKENLIFQAHLILSKDSQPACFGFNIIETGKDDFELFNIIFKPEESITFNKKHKNKNEVLYFDLKFDQKSKTYSGSWESDIFRDKKKGSTYIVMLEIDENVDFISNLS